MKSQDQVPWLQSNWIQTQLTFLGLMYPPVHRVVLFKVFEEIRRSGHCLRPPDELKRYKLVITGNLSGQDSNLLPL